MNIFCHLGFHRWTLWRRSRGDGLNVINVILFGEPALSVKHERNCLRCPKVEYVSLYMDAEEYVAGEA